MFKVWMFLGGMLLLGGSYVGVGFYFYEKGSSESKAVIAQYQADQTAKAADIQNQVQKSNDQVVIKYVDRDKVITQTKYQYVKDTASLPKAPNLSNGWVNLHDASVLETPITDQSIADASDSGISPNKALSKVVSNYSTCKSIRNQLISLQDSIRQQAAITSKEK